MKEIVCAGFGGQGILTTGFLLAGIGIKADKQVTWIPSYGSEMRGGTANCAVKISDEPIASPYIRNNDILIALNSPSVERFQPDSKKGGYMFVNSSIVSGVKYREDLRVIEVPANEMAVKHANPRAANLVMLGALAAVNLFAKDFFVTGITEYFTQKGINPEKNLVVFEDGFQFVKGLKPNKDIAN